MTLGADEAAGTSGRPSPPQGEVINPAAARGVLLPALVVNQTAALAGVGGMVNFGRRDRGITTANTPATTFDRMAAPTGVGGMVVFGRRDRGIAAAATPPAPSPRPVPPSIEREPPAE